MKNRDVIFHSLGHSILVLVYTSGVAWLLFNGKKLFGGPDTFLAPLFMLLLFVLSATIVGTLMLGRPLLLYLDGEKREALQFFGCTLLWIFLITLTALALLRMNA